MGTANSGIARWVLGLSILLDPPNLLFGRDGN